jgi:membrane protease YdiL (CAAX protease family)
MATIKAFIKKHPVSTYFILTFAISWGGVLILGTPYGMPTTPAQFAKHWPIVFLPYFLGPTIAGLLLTGFVRGRAGFRELLSRLMKWRVGGRWYAVALLVAPILVTVILFALSLMSRIFLPGIVTATNRIGLILSGLVVGLVFGGLLEELGWTGFAVPGLRLRYGILTTGLIVGLLWGAWHFLPTFWGSGDSSGGFSLLLFLPPCLFYAGVLPAYRVLMVWVYDRTRSLFVAMLMHASLTASTLFILAPSARGISLSVYYLILTAVMWGVVAVVAAANRGQLSRRPPDENQGNPQAKSPANPRNTIRQRTWQRVILLCVLGYEAAGCLSGGYLLVAEPDGRLMDMSVDIMHGFFPDFFIPGLILIGLGILNTASFVAVLRRTRTDWLLAGLALGGLVIWFTVEIIVLRQVHWLHGMWGLPVLLGCAVALPLVPSRRAARQRSRGG